MKLRPSALLFALPLMAPYSAHALNQLVPAGSTLSCTISEGKISSKTEHVGDPILCRVGHTETYGNMTFPYGSYLVGDFAEYKDPGHLVGKGWMELKFNRLVLPDTDTVVPVNVRVVEVPKYRVDADGKILGNGHAVKDTVTWLIPVLWPLDLINLARRGPRPVLKPETKLTLRVLDDFGLPSVADATERQITREGSPALVARQQAHEDAQYPQQQQYAPQPQYQQPQQQYAPPPQVNYNYYPQQQQSPVVVVQAPAPQTTIVQQAPQYHYAPPPPAYVYPYGPYGPPVRYGYPGYYRPY